MDRKKRILVVGLGKSGLAMMNAFYALDYIVDVYDGKSEEKIADIEWIKNHSAHQYFNSEPQVDAYDYIAMSPGVPPDLPWLNKARDAGVEVSGEIEWAYRLAKGEFIGITGTNGKTTTTQLTYNIFHAFFDNVELVGNIGIPAVEKAAETDEERIFITELSSFQLETIDTFKVKIGAILNITPDHLNRHKTMENYIEAKLDIFKNMTADGYRVLNYDDEFLREYGKKYENTFFFSRMDILSTGCFIEDKVIYVFDNEKSPIMNIDDILILGNHNIENVLAAISIAYLSGIPIDIIASTIKAFKGVEHRLEIFEKKCGRLFINDSKGTNPDATIKAIQSMKTPTILLAGGMDKGSDFTDMVNQFKPYIKHLILYGETKKIIKDTAEKNKYTAITLVDNLDEAVAAAMEVSSVGDTILLSPACASWDMYPNFEVRGLHFKSIVEKLG